MADENGTPEAVPGNVLEGEHLLLGGSMEPDAQEIGRASCRERV